jgi:hypothetical protein
MSDEVTVCCRVCGKTKEVNYFQGYIFGWPFCCGRTRMLIQGSIDPTLKARATEACYLRREDRSNIPVAPSGSNVSTWKIKHRRPA